MQAGRMGVQQPGEALPGVVRVRAIHRPADGGDVPQAGSTRAWLALQAILRPPHFAVDAGAAGDGQSQIDHVTDPGRGCLIAHLENIGQALVPEQCPLGVVLPPFVQRLVLGPDPGGGDLRDGIDRFRTAAGHRVDVDEGWTVVGKRSHGRDPFSKDGASVPVELPVQPGTTCRCGHPCTEQDFSDGERGAEPVERGQRVAGGKRLQADDAVVTQPVERGGDSGVVDLTGAGFAPAGDIGDLDLADQRQGPLDQLDQVSLADLRVVQVEIHSEMGIVDRLDQRQGVRGLGERGSAGGRRRCSGSPG